MAAIMEAKRSIRLCTGYFVPTRREIEELARAARRGVDVRLLLPGVTDTPVATAAQRASYGPLLEAGVRIVEVTDSVLHAKIAVVDGDWSAVGSSNLDHLSLRVNLEVVAVIIDRALGARAEAEQRRDEAMSREVVLAEWRRRPWWHRPIEWLFYQLRSFL